MAIELSQEVRKQLRASIKRYALENLEQDIGDLKADMLLEYFLKEIGPTVYNQAISHAQSAMSFLGQQPNMRLKLTAPVICGKIAFVIIPARRRSLGAIR